MLIAIFEPHLLWTVGGILLLVAIVSPVFLIATARAYARMRVEGIRLATWDPRPAPFARMLRVAFLVALRYILLLSVLTVAIGFFDEWRTAGPVAVVAVLAFATAEFWIASRIRRWEHVHGFALFRETRVAFGRVAQRLVRVPL
jgi:hypothetical protein